MAYRFVQEALTNISKHAQATRVVIDLSLTRGVLSVEVSDNGRGLSATDLAKAKSFGLRGLHERAGTVGGWVDVSSGPSGTVLMLGVPLEVGRGHPGQEELDLEDEDDPGPPAHDDSHDPSAWGNL